MNRLLTYEGGQPLTTGDFDFLQECYAQAIENLAQGITNGQDCVLHGIEYEQEGFVSGHVNKGSVCLSGEILVVPEALDVSGARYLCFRQVESESREFRDAQTHKVYLRHEAYLASNAEGAYKYLDLTKAKRLTDVLSGEALWGVSEMRTFTSGAYGSINERRMNGQFDIRVTASKNTSVDNVLYTYATTRLPIPKVGIAVNGKNNRIIVVLDLLGTCKLFNADGTDCNDAVELNNVIIK